MFRLAFLAMFFTMPVQTYAQENLWRDLNEGDHPELVEEKLSAVPEIKRVKTRIRKGELREQDINMIDDGLPIFEGNFQVSTEYKGLGLTKVQLSSDERCANTVYSLAEKIHGTLAKKYPTTIHTLSNDIEMTQASLAATPEYPQTLTSAYSDEQTVALLSVEFFRTDPPIYPGGGSLARSLYQIARNTYDTKARSCAGTGYRTAQVRVTYVSRSSFEEQLDDAVEEAEVEYDNASDIL